MDALLHADAISGPHVAHLLESADGRRVLLLGEEHTNAHQCADVGGTDAVAGVIACARAGVHVYLEMPTRYVAQDSVNDLACPRSEGRARRAVLNELRTCLFILKVRRGVAADNVHFVDPRELVGTLPYTDAERAFVASRPRADEVLDRFELPLRRARDLVYPKLHPAARPHWVADVSKRADEIRAATAWARDPARATVQSYRDAIDAVMDLYAFSRMRVQMEKGARDHVVYAGSAHAKRLLELLTADGDLKVTRRSVASTNVSCARLRAV